MKRRSCSGAILSLLVAFGGVPAAAQKMPPMEAKVVYKGFKDGELVRVQKGAQVPMYHVVASFYGRAFSSLAEGEATFHEFLRDMDIEPGSEPAKALAKAALQAEALRYDGEDETKLLPDEEAFLEAQRRTIRADKEALARIHVELLKRFQAAGYPPEKLQNFLEKEIRPGITITMYGGKVGEPSLTYEIVGNFAEEVENGLAAPPQEDMP
jgi:hypothetical protein